jgi:transposase
LSTKLHIAVDALGNPLRIRLTPGQRHEITQAEALIEGFAAASVIADTAFDADAFRARLEEQGSTAVIPSHPSRSKSIEHDEHLYKERHVVECFIGECFIGECFIGECFIGKMKHFRRIATRYEKTARNFLAMITLAATMIWLR